MFGIKNQIIRDLENTIDKLERHIKFYKESIEAFNAENISLKEEIKFNKKWLSNYDKHFKLEHMRNQNTEGLMQESINSLTEEVNRKDDDIETLLYELYTANKRIKTLEESNKEAYTKLYSASKENGKLRKENVKLKLNSKYGTLIHAVCPECSEEISDLLGDLYESTQHESYQEALLDFFEEIINTQNKMIKKLKEKLDKQ